MCAIQYTKIGNKPSFLHSGKSSKGLEFNRVEVSSAPFFDNRVVRTRHRDKNTRVILNTLPSSTFGNVRPNRVRDYGSFSHRSAYPLVARSTRPRWLQARETSR